MENHYDLVIIGGGPGGYEAALEAVERGLTVGLVEKEALGGTCLNHGCIPTKTLMHATELYRKMGSCEELGIKIDSLFYNIKTMQKRKAEVLETLRSGIEGLMKKKKITVFDGVGTITGEHQVTVSLTEGGNEVLVGDNILIATGSSTFVPPIPGVELHDAITSDELLDKADDVYDHLIIIGGGVIGMEFACIYSALGTKVTVIEALDRILANLDKEIAQNLKMILKKRGVEIHAGARVESISKGSNGELVCTYTEKEKECQTEGDGILVAVGRRANTENLFGEGISMEMNRGQILVNEFYQTSIKNIYAIGDVIGGIMLAHVATAEGKNAVNHMVGQPSSICMDVVPSCVYTDPEIGCVGITAEEAKAKEIPVITKKYVMSANGKSVLSAQERGFIKVVAEEKTGKILGAQMMCARATDMISEFATAIVNELTLEDMGAVIRPHPTFSEGITEVVRL